MPNSAENESAPVIGPAGREIVIAHDPAAKPVSAVRNMMLQASLAQLREGGYYDRYVAVADPSAREWIETTIAPGWTPVDIAYAHYRACDELALSSQEIATLGAGVGDHLQGAFVSAAKKVREKDFDLWSEIAPLHRVWGRIYQGGSVQIVKLGPKDQLTELRGFPLARYRHYRLSQNAAIGITFEGLGVRVETVKVASYNAQRGELVIRIAWT